jgi:hypothetical protein
MSYGGLKITIYLLMFAKNSQKIKYLNLKMSYSFEKLANI